MVNQLFFATKYHINKLCPLFLLLTIFAIVVLTLQSSPDFKIVDKYLNYQNGIESDRSHKMGDRTYYLHGALSIYDFEIEKKFNDKLQPILKQKNRVFEKDMPWYAKYFLFLYPYPSFKFGYSLLSALVTWPFPDSWFNFHIDRLHFANILFILCGIVILYFLCLNMGLSRWCSTIPCLFFIFDVSNTYNSFVYQSHTMIGLLLVFIAFFTASLKSKKYSIKIFYIAFCLIFSVFSSSHSLHIASISGIAIFLMFFLELEQTKQRLIYIVSATAGLLIIPLYILGMESFFNFKELGLPTYLGMLKQYKFTIGELIETYPLYARFMWDLTIFNVFIVPLILLLISSLLFKIICQKKYSTLSEGLLEFIRKNKLFVILLFSILASTLISAFYSQPLSRAMTPFTVFFGILSGYIFAKYIRNKLIIPTIIIMLVSNYYFLLGIIDFPEDIPKGNYFALNEDDVISKNTKAFYTNTTLPYEYKYFSKSISEFVSEHDKKFATNIETYIIFDASYLILAYSSTRRFHPKFQHNKKFILDKKTIVNDFNLLNEIISKIPENELDKYIIARKNQWKFSMWDQENHYIYGKLDDISKYTSGTKLEYFDVFSKYYIKYSKLRELADKNSLNKA